MEKMRQGNEAKLEQMRATVDEKLQSTLETRLGEKFKAVSEQLAAVHQGLGEMQNLANDVGNLQRTLTNVKTRGGWGEAQLGALLEDFLTLEQYQANVRVIPESSELVEFAIKLPGQDAGTVWLPIDSKFPQEDYERLLNAQQAGDPNEVERCAAHSERRSAFRPA
jgi:DNA recombination protein RmuC